MDADNTEEPNADVPIAPRRSRRLALTELNDSLSSPETPSKTPSPNPDEMIIIQRGPRRKPLTWSPVNYEFSKRDLLGPPRTKTPEKKPLKSDLNPKLRRRLIMSPTKQSGELGFYISKRLRSLQNAQEK